MLVILALGRLKQEDPELEAHLSYLSYTVSLSQLTVRDPAL
jgi:hypothetical protein